MTTERSFTLASLAEHESCSKTHIHTMVTKGCGRRGPDGEVCPVKLDSYRLGHLIRIRPEAVRAFREHPCLSSSSTTGAPTGTSPTPEKRAADGLRRARLMKKLHAERSISSTPT